MPLIKFRRGDKGNWIIRGTVRGQSIYESTGTSDEEAAEAIRVQAEVRLLNESIYGKKAVVTFQEAAESFVSSGGSDRFIFEIRKKTQKPVGLAVHFRNKLLHTITQRDLDEAARKLYPGCLPETLVRQCYAPFIAVWNHAVRNQWAEPRQWSRPKKAKGTAILNKKYRSGSHPVSYDHAMAFIAGMSPAPAMVMTTLFLTGMRPIELFALQSKDVDINNRWLVVQSSKIGEKRGVPIHEYLVPLLSALKVRTGQMFLTHKREPYPLTEDYGGQLSTAITGARKRTGIKDISPYTARHSFSTQLVINGVHPYIKDQILGHAADDMSRLYTTVPQQPLIEAVNTIRLASGWSEFVWYSDPIKWEGRLINWGKKSHSSKAA